MPSYDFQCPVCLDGKTVFASFDEDLNAPSCGPCSITMQRVWSSPAAIFKGTGWGKDA